MKKITGGIFGVWKPKGPSSYDVIRVLKHMSTEKKIGHAGTLDPLASGILVIAIGREATKQISNEVAKEKEYVASIRLGVTSTTDDREGIKTKNISTKKISRNEIRNAINQFEGKIMQVPPVYSAIKVKGKEAYKRTRAGEKIVMKPREVLIKEIEVLSYRWPYLSIRVVTGPGVYIRSLARDIGVVLGVGGYLSNLIRTRVGTYTKETALHPKVKQSRIKKRS
ncbi:MAG: tRNA pseudouridine(55) synthase TruB [Candidatus Paceibacterota bacterium]|jgi:tRNA pseudouridine55 synthase